MARNYFNGWQIATNAEKAEFKRERAHLNANLASTEGYVFENFGMPPHLD